ncbi:MAG: acetate--CoA ligase family protein, partial [Chloroflexota bacterium]
AEVLACYGIQAARQTTAATAGEVATAAAAIGGPVALKAVAPGLVHKTEAGAVALGLERPDEAVSAALAMEQRVRAAGHVVTGFIVQEMVGDGIEMMAGVTHDPQFGPVIACGAGGTLIELLKDITVRLSPLTAADAEEMVQGLKTAPLLAGYRGSPPCDAAALQDILLRVSAMAEDLPQIVEMDLNPIMVRQQGAIVIDARIRVEAPPPPLPLSARRR